MVCMDTWSGWIAHAYEKHFLGFLATDGALDWCGTFGFHVA